MKIGKYVESSKGTSAANMAGSDFVIFFTNTAKRNPTRGSASLHPYRLMYRGLVRRGPFSMFYSRFSNSVAARLHECDRRGRNSPQSKIANQKSKTQTCP